MSSAVSDSLFGISAMNLGLWRSVRRIAPSRATVYVNIGGARSINELSSEGTIPMPMPPMASHVSSHQPCTRTAVRRAPIIESARLGVTNWTPRPVLCARAPRSVCSNPMPLARGRVVSESSVQTESCPVLQPGPGVMITSRFYVPIGSFHTRSHCEPMLKVVAAVEGASKEILLKLLRNVLKDPSNEKFRKVRLTNPKIKATITDVPPAMDLLLVVSVLLPCPI